MKTVIAAVISVALLMSTSVFLMEKQQSAYAQAESRASVSSVSYYNK